MRIFRYKQPERRIARQLIYSLILASAFITLIITAFQLYRDYSYDIDQIDKRFVQIGHVYLQPLSHALWATDRKEMQLQIDGMKRLPDMQYIAVYENNKVLVTAGEIKQKNIISNKFPLKYEHRGVLRTIGELEVVATLDGVYGRLFDKVWVILISNAIKTFIIAVFFMYIFQKLVTRHINHLADQVRGIDADDLNKPLTLERSTNRNNSGDEFEVLINAFDGMRKRIHDDFEKIRRREEELRLYEMIMTTTEDQMSYIDRNYIYQAVNTAYTKFHGKSRNEIIGKSVQDLLGEKLFLELSKPNLDKVFEGRQLQYIGSVLNKDAKVVQLEINYYPYYGGAEDVQGAVVNARDVTERIRAEQDRLRNSQVYAALAQQGAIEYKDFLQTSLALLKEVFQSKYAFVGRLIENTLTIQTECVLFGDRKIDNFIYDLAGTPCEKVFDRDKVFYYNNVIKDYPKDVMLIDMDAQTYFGVSLADTQGKIIGLIAVLDTEPHEYEPWHEDTLEVFAARIAVEMERADVLYKLESYNEELEKQVELRTYELQNSIKELETFSYSVSHDLRAPLRAINGFSQILIEDYARKLGEDGVVYLTKIRTSSERMSRLIDDLLRLSRISRQNMEFEYIDLSKMCENIIKQNYDLACNRNVQFSIQPGITAFCDAKLIRIALENLIDNAIKYSSKETSPEITIGIKQDCSNQLFYIGDNGVGFDTKYADKIFQPFQRLHNGDFNGTGIGLATVLRIIERHGGSIRAESKPRQGAWFYFELPGGYFQQQEQNYTVI
jgi:PAS domain S-box-containing protein